MDLTGQSVDGIVRIRAWLEWATAQIDATLGFDADASAQLASAVYGVLDDPRLAERVDSTVPAHEMAVSAAMQHHDRLMQQLTHVSEGLRALMETLQTKPGVAQWAALRQRQLSRFSMAEERALFHLLVPEAGVEPPGYAAAADAQSSLADSVEFF